MTWKYAVGTPSSFEQALDDVVRKLDEMEPKEAASEEPRSAEGNSRVPRETATKQDGVPGQNVGDSQSPMQKMATKAADLLESVTHEIHSQLHKPPAKVALSPDSKLKRTKAVRRLRGPEDRRPVPEVDPTQSKSDGRAKKKAEPKAAYVVNKPLTPVVAASSSQEPRRRPTKDHPKAPARRAGGKIADHLRDSDINDRDVLRGLKLAVSAACDETLDSWIREKTGLRLRRFLADLKTFEDLEREEVDGGKSGPGVAKTKAPENGRDGAEEEEEEEEEKAGLGDNEADSDDRRPGRRRAEKGRLDKARGFARQQEQVIEE